MTDWLLVWVGGWAYLRIPPGGITWLGEEKWQDWFKHWRTPWGPYEAETEPAWKERRSACWQKEQFQLMCTCFLNMMSLGLVPRESCESYWLHRIKSDLKRTGHSGVCPGCRGCRGKPRLCRRSLLLLQREQNRKAGVGAFIVELRLTSQNFNFQVFLNFKNERECIFKSETLAYCRHCVT